MEVMGGRKGEGGRLGEVVVNGERYVKQKGFGRMVESKEGENKDKIRIEENEDESFVQKIETLEESLLKSKSKASNKQQEKQKRMLQSKVVHISPSTSKHHTTPLKHQPTPLNFSTAFPDRIKRVMTQNEQDYQYLTNSKPKNTNSISLLPQAIEHTHISTNQTRKRSKDRKPIFEKKGKERVNFSEDKRYNNQDRFKSIQEKLKENQKILEEERVQVVRWPKEKTKEERERQVDKVNVKAEAIHKQMSNLRNNNNTAKKPSHPTVTKPTHSRSPSPSIPLPSRSSLLKLYSTGIYFNRQAQPIRTNTFKKQLNKISRERFMTDAMTIPGIDNCFSYSDIYELYLEFKEMGMEEYRWKDYLQEQVRKVGRFNVVRQRYTTN